MAQVSFSITAIDRTRAAFASINQSLRGLVLGGDSAQKKMLGLGLRMAGIGSIAAVLGNQVRKVATEIEKVPGVSQETIQSWEQLKGRAAIAQNVIGKAVAVAGEGISSLAGIIRFGLVAAYKGLDEAQADLLENEKENLAAFRESSGYNERLAESTKKLAEARKELANVNESAGMGVVRRRAESAEMEKSAASISDEIERNKKLTEAVELRTSAEKDFRKIQEENAKAQTAAGNAFNAAYGFTIPLKERIEGLQSAYGQLNYELAKYNDLQNPVHIEKRTKLFEQQKTISEQLGKALSEQNKIAREVGQTISSSFEDAVFAGEDLRGMLKGIYQDLLRLIFRNIITQPLANFITAGLGSMFGGGLAVGGPVSAGTSYLVGEKGPELFVPSQAGRIIPNHEAGAGGSGSAFSFIYNIAAGVSKAELLPILKAQQRDTISKISEVERRGLPMSAALTA